MAKNVFFSFHYEDVISFRANVVRNHDTVKGKQAGYFDKSIWEDAKKTSTLALKRLINNNLDGTSVTCVLIGSQTYARTWVIYEIFRSIYKGNKIIGVYINRIKGKDGLIKSNGPNPFDFTGVYFNEDGSSYAFITRSSHTSQWKFWEEIDSCSFFRNQYFTSQYAYSNRGKCISLSSFLMTYDWISDNGYTNFKNWIL